MTWHQLQVNISVPEGLRWGHCISQDQQSKQNTGGRTSVRAELSDGPGDARSDKTSFLQIANF